MTPRLFLPLAATLGQTLDVEGDELHYARSVLRLASGAAVEVFNGDGRQWGGHVLTVGRTAAQVRLDVEHDVVSEPAFQVTLALSVLKPDLMDAAVRDAVMVGASRVQPVMTSRSQLPRVDARGSLARRWRRIALSGARQSGRPTVPVVEDLATLPDWLRPQHDRAAVKLVLTEPSLSEGGGFDVRASRARAESHGVMLLVGPEGGWTDEELALARAAGFQPWTVNRRTLRADAVPVAALSILYFAWDRGQASHAAGL